MKDVLTDLSESLQDEFRRGILLSNQRYLLEEGTIDWIGNLKVSINPDDHNPPHFHIMCDNESARFTFNDCAPMEISNKLKRYQRNIQKWCRENKNKLLKVWNQYKSRNY